MFAQHRTLAIFFGVLALALAAYFIKSVRAARPSPPPTQSVYIQVVPQTPAPTAP